MEGDIVRSFTDMPVVKENPRTLRKTTDLRQVTGNSPLGGYRALTGGGPGSQGRFQNRKMASPNSHICENTLVLKTFSVVV